MIDSDGIRARFDALSPHLDERERRLLAATEAKAAGFGGIAEVSRLTGVVASTIGRGLRDLAAGARLETSASIVIQNTGCSGSAADANMR